MHRWGLPPSIGSAGSVGSVLSAGARGSAMSAGAGRGVLAAGGTGRARVVTLSALIALLAALLVGWSRTGAAETASG